MNYVAFDWNWFFSSFSQCGAAIIGIISGFVISRLLDINNKLNFCTEDFNELKIKYRNLDKRINQIKFRDYFDKTLRSIPIIYSMVKGKQLSGKTDNEILNHLYRFCNEDLYKADAEILELIKIIINNPGQYMSEFTNNRLRNSRSELRTITKSSINELKLQSETLIEKYKYNEIKLSNLLNGYRNLRIIISILLISLFSLVIYPLHFIPLGENLIPQITTNLIHIFENISWIKIILLIIFFVLIGSIFIYFLIDIYKKIKVIKSQKTKFGKYIDILNYSPYFEAISIIP